MYPYPNFCGTNWAGSIDIGMLSCLWYFLAIEINEVYVEKILDPDISVCTYNGQLLARSNY